MHGLSPEFDPKVFVGHLIAQVSFVENGLDIQFDGDLGVMAENGLRVRPTEGAEFRQVDPSGGAEDLVRLIGRRVLAATGRTEGTLVLDIDGGAVVEWRDDSEQYECYHIRSGGREFHV